VTDALPHDPRLERAVLASIILRPECAGQVAFLGPLSFHAQRHRLIFRAIVDVLIESGTLDLNLLVHKLAETGDLEAVGGSAYLGSLMDAGAISSHVAAYGAKLRDLEHRRAVLVGADEVSALARKESASVVTAALAAIAEKIAKKTASAVEVRSIDVAQAMTGEVPEIPWLAEGWIGQGDLCVLAGEWATGKSLIALDLALAVTLGHRWVGVMPCTQGPVLYLDEENAVRNACRRLARMARGRNVSNAEAADLRLRYLSQNGINLDDRASYDIVRREIDLLQPVLVILDAAIRFHSRDENKASQMALWYRERVKPLQRICGSALVLIDHMSKPTKDSEAYDPAHRVRGSGDKLGVVDVGLTLEGDRETDTRILSASKVRWLDDLPPKLQTRWRRSEDDDAGWIEAVDATKNADAMLAQILREAGGDGIRARDLWTEATKRGVSERTGRRRIKGMIAAGTAVGRKEGRTGLRYWLADIKRKEDW